MNHDEINKNIIIDRLKEVIDPELGINVYDLGLIYNIDMDQQTRHINITMTLTTPGCPLHDSIKSGVYYAVDSLDEVNSVDVQLVWSPPWSPAMLSEQAKQWLGRA